MSNTFGGKNPRSLYTPMSEIEQEFISRLIETGDLRIHIIGWGVVNNPRVTFGDKRLSLRFDLDFDAPEAPVPIRHFDLELRTGSGVLLFKKRQTVTCSGKPIEVAAGVTLGMVWDIAIHMIDPEVIKSLMPAVTGLTTRMVDKDTGQQTLTGNMALDSKKKSLLQAIRRGEEAVRQMDRK